MVAPYVQQAPWARVVFDVTLAAFAAAELRQSLKRRRDASRANLRAEVAFRAAFFAAILVLPLAQGVVPEAALASAGIFVAGAVVAWMGLLLRWWSFAALGRYFTTVVRTSPDQVVVTRGPYRVLRHPSYTGLLAVFLGGGLMFGNAVGAAVSFVILLGALVHRLLAEEHALADALGEEYVSFASKRARLVPHVW